MVKNNVHIPYKLRKKYLPRIYELNIAPEFYFEGPDFKNFDYGELEEIARKIKSMGVSPSIHAPFLDTNLSAQDEEIVRIVNERIFKTLEFAKILNATGIVIHPGYDPFRYNGMEESWFKNISRNLEPILKKAEELKIYLAVENIFEHDFSNLKKLIEHFDSPFLGHCFDTGHFNIFARTSLSDWLNEMGRYFMALHIHDNMGFKDDHIPVGEGSFPFKYFVAHLPEKNLRWITMEMHDEEEVHTCLRNWHYFYELKNNE